MAKLLITKSVKSSINPVRKIDKMTNEQYSHTAQEADRRIEQNNRNYAAASKRASRYSAG